MSIPRSDGSSRGGTIPLWVKGVYTLWLAVWVPVYWLHAGPQNFLWLCDVGNLLLGAALWLESPLLFSSQATGLLVPQTLWAVDFLAALAVGVHPFGGTEYMFDASKPLWLRSFSLFHLAVPPLLLWGVWRLGYDRRGLRLETALAWVLLPLTWRLVPPEHNVNWVWEPFGAPQTVLPPLAYLAVLLVAYPLALFLPGHLALTTWARRSRVRPELVR